MPALKTLGMVILAAFVVSLGILGYRYASWVSDEGKAKDAALEVERACRAAIASGSPQTVKIKLPGNWQISFVDNQISLDNLRVPSGGFEMRFADNSPTLGPGGEYELTITIENSRLVVRT